MLVQSPHSFPIADLHCDLLLYLCMDPKRTPYDPIVRCAIPQLISGHVKIQTLAISTETRPGSSHMGQHQAEIFKTLPSLYPETFTHLKRKDQLDTAKKNPIVAIVPAIENASAFCDEDEDLEMALKKLTTWQHKIGKLAYLSLTWGTENRFGGGNMTSIGLKDDGKQLIDYLYEKKIPIDFSHTSDPLAYAILNYLDKNNLKLPILASHSNLRAVTNVPRNLPDEIAKEILERQGVIGFNFIRHFVGENHLSFAHQLQHLLLLKGLNQVCFGADFYCDADWPVQYRQTKGSFFPDFGNASTYVNVINLWRQNTSLDETAFADICFNNLAAFLQRTLF